MPVMNDIWSFVVLMIDETNTTTTTMNNESENILIRKKNIKIEIFLNI